MATKEAINLLEGLVSILEAQSEVSIANQIQCLEGYSALFNYNHLAREAKEFLENL